MHENLFRMREESFRINPDARYLFFNLDTKDGWKKLRYGIEARKGLMVLTGDVGTGKTTIATRLVDWLRQQNAHIASVFNSRLETGALLDLILAHFGLPPEPRTKDSPLLRLRRWLLDRCRVNEIAVLIIDEAQGLSLDALRQVQILMEAEGSDETPLQVVLVGQPALEEVLNRPELSRLRRRIAIRCKMARLTCE